MELETVKSRAYEAGYFDYFDGNDDPPSGDLRSFRYRRLPTKLRDFDSVPADRRIDVAWKLWLSSPMAKRILVLKRDHIIERGTVPTCEDEELLDILLDFWQQNKLGARASEFALQLFLFGEQCYPAFVRESDGRVMLGYIDPEQIEQVRHHPDNALEPWAVVLKQEYSTLSRIGTAGRMVYRIIREAQPVVYGDEVQEVEYEGMLVTPNQTTLEDWEIEWLRGAFDKAEYDGCCFFTKVNAVSNQPRGVSDLIQIADFIDQADATLFGMGDREQMADYFFFDVTVENADDAKIKERANWYRQNPPKKGTVNVHNAAETLQAIVPDLKQAGSVTAFRAFLGFILGGAGFPVHWYGFGDDANRATAVAQGDPTEKSLEHDQGLYQDMMETILRFVRDQAIIAGSLAENDEQEVRLPLPDVSTKDTKAIIGTMAPMAAALVASRDAGWITQQTAAEVWARILSEFGVDIDPTTELEAAAEENEEAELAQAQAMNTMLAQRLGQNGNGAEMPMEETP